MSDTVKTALYIGGQERHTTEQMAIADPAKAGGIVGYAASATVQDVAEADAGSSARGYRDSQVQGAGAGIRGLHPGSSPLRS
jgi:hypothetical protein